MSTLAELQRLFAGVLMDGEDASSLEAQVRGDARASAVERVAIYREMYRQRLLDVLAEVYPRTAVLLGEERFAEHLIAYVRAHPSLSPSLRDYGRELHTLLDPRAAALAQLEWARYDVFDAEDEQVLSRDDLAGLGAEALAAIPLHRLRASRLLRLVHDADALWRGEAGTDARPSIVLVWREGVRIFHRRVEPTEAALLAILDGTLSIGALCERSAADRSIEQAAQEVFTLIGRWIADGLLARPDGRSRVS